MEPGGVVEGVYERVGQSSQKSVLAPEGQYAGLVALTANCGCFRVLAPYLSIGSLKTCKAVNGSIGAVS